MAEFVSFAGEVIIEWVCFGLGITMLNSPVEQSTKSPHVMVNCVARTAFFDELSFEPAADSSAYLNPDEVAGAVLTVLKADGAITDLTIRPLKSGVKKKRRSGSR